MAAKATIDDRLLRAIGIPSFGVSIPHLTGLFGALGPRDAAYWAGHAWFVLLAALIWHANRWLLFAQREHVDWFGRPLQKIMLLLVGVVFGTVPVTIAMLRAWYAFAGVLASAEAIAIVTLTNVICVVFVTHVYETVFLVKERAADLVMVEQLGRAKAEAELEALKNQVDPHFLFNSLNTLGYLIDHDAAGARAFNARLARVYRYILSSRGRPLVLLADELSFLSDYAELLGVRFGEALRVRSEGEARPDRRLVPPISLQVLLENAVKHNELSRATPLEVRVRFEDRAVVVENERRPRRDAPASAGVGLTNLAERCRLATGLDVEVTDGPQGFAVRVPLLAV